MAVVMLLGLSWLRIFAKRYSVERVAVLHIVSDGKLLLKNCSLQYQVLVGHSQSHFASQCSRELDDFVLFESIPSEASEHPKRSLSTSDSKVSEILY
jgi:hypothetical protein